MEHVEALDRGRVVAKVAANVRSALAWRGLKPRDLEAPLSLSYSGVSRRLGDNADAVAFDIGELAVVAGLVRLPLSALIEGGPPWDEVNHP